ncbi:hypothetical protein PV327_001188 [Microctonus hyperodae]|uniref:ER-bound oxygenase mpaB/mpaB'/Rubber oxygenase catalytic domain-containing protein n=1 Tax=Microctonus hyperodae TaxID=165561 RepID=A0AA39G823_MICHY|nr:hypothetical protein PV327_001188 [Microctonus hyperodae]
MEYAIECINDETGCNDRRHIDESHEIQEQFTNSITNRKYSNESSENNSHKPQNIMNLQENDDIKNYEYDTICIKKIIAFMSGGTTLISEWNELNESEKFETASKWVREKFVNLPESLIPIVIGGLFPNRNENFIDEMPEWLDREKFMRGQRFARDYFFGIFFAELLSLFTLFSFESGLKPLIITEKSSEPYTAFTRYLSTANRVRHWYTSDPWTKGTAAYNNIKIVNKKHQNVRDKLSNLTNEEIDKAGSIDKIWAPSRDVLIEDFRSLCPAGKPGQCPYLISDLSEVVPSRISQGDMSATQFGFIGLIILYPEAFGIHSATDEDLEAFCHLWRGLGYLLGIQDRYNFANGTLDEVKQRSRDFLYMWVKPNLRDITPEWEHMMRCLLTGLQYYFPGTSYEISLLYLAELMGLEMPQFQSSMSYYNKMQYNVVKLVLKYPYKLPIIRKLLNKKVHNHMDRALDFDNKKHSELREKSSKTMSQVVKNKYNNNDKIDDDKLPIIEAKYSQYKIIGVLMVITQCLILWRVTPISALM